MLGNVRAMTCNQVYASAAVAGALSSPAGLDTLLVARGFPREVHWALTGLAIDTLCRGKLIPSIDQQSLMSAAAGYAGGFAYPRARLLLGV